MVTRSERVLSRALSTLLIVLLAVLCAHWFWIFAAPAVSAPAEQGAAGGPRPLDGVRRASLFGAGAAAAAPAPVRADLVLRGVSATRQGAMAVIAIDRARAVTVREGEEIAPGIRLERVQHDHVLVVQNGITQRVDFPQRKPVDVPPVAGAAVPARR